MKATNKFLPKTVSAILCILLIAGCFSFSLASVSASGCSDYSLSDLRAKFTNASYNGESYAYFSPAVKGETKKYPVVVFLHGFGHELSYLSKSWMPYYASYYLQAKFADGGAHVIIPQIWHITTGSRQLHGLISDYVKANKETVDTDEIILIGASLGARQAYNIAVENPGYYSSVVLCCPAVWFTQPQLKKIADTPVWLISSKRDVLTGNHKSSWNTLLKSTNVPEKCRWTYFDGDVFSPDGEFQLSHFLAKTLGCDGAMLDGTSYTEKYKYVSVIDGNGSKAGESFIAWADENAGK